MSHNLEKEKVSRLLWQLSIPAILGMLSSAIFNIADRIFVGKINSMALTAVGITMPIQIFQMAFILLIGIGSSSLISIKLGEGKKEEAEDILYLAFKYIILFLILFSVLFLLFLNPLLSMLAVSKQVIPYAKIYIVIIVVGAIIGIPGYCLNNTLRAIGQAKMSMKIIVITSLLNIILDPIFIFTFKLGIAGAAIATVLSQTVLTVYVVYAFIKRTDFLVNLRRRKIERERIVLKEFVKMGMPSFYVQILATVVNMIINYSLLIFGTDLDVAAVTIMASIFSFYHMVIVGIVQGNNTICGYNWGAKQYGRVRKSLELSLLASFILSSILFAMIQLFPHLLVDIFTNDTELAKITSSGIKLYLSMLPLVGVQIVSSQYYQSVGKATKSSILSFLRYGIIIIPAIIILAPSLSVKGIYLSNALSDGIASVISVVYIWFEIKKLKQLEHVKLISNE